MSIDPGPAGKVTRRLPIPIIILGIILPVILILGVLVLGDMKTLWVPDLYGENVYRFTITNFPLPGYPTFYQNTSIDVSSFNCTPNSVVMRNNTLYIACTSYGTSGTDQVLAYNTLTNKFGPAITGLGTDNNQYFNGLIALVVDRYQNLWVSSYVNNLLLRVSSGTSSGNLDSSDPPLVDRSVYNSPGAPAGMTIDPRDGSLWIVGQYHNGIVVNFPATNDTNVNSVNQPGTFLGNGNTGNALGPSLNPVFCIALNPGDCSQPQTAPFNNPEGVTVFNNAVWVSNNGGTAPTGTILQLTKAATGNTLSSKVYGGNIGNPFSCPGGLFATAPTTFWFHTNPATLWVNDEAFGRGGAGQPPTVCGFSDASHPALPGDTGPTVGRVIEFLAGDLSQPTQPTPETFANSNKIVTSSPGFGGIYVQSIPAICFISMRLGFGAGCRNWL